jgi:hypothetical protein
MKIHLSHIEPAIVPLFYFLPGISGFSPDRTASGASA